MKRQRMQKSGCSMLVAALVGLLPIAAGHAQETGRTFGQEPETGTMGSPGALQDMDEVQLQGPEQGAEGPRREDTDAMPAAHDIRDPERRQDAGTQFHGSGERGAQGPLREDTGMDADATRDRDLDVRGAEGPLRQDTDLDEQTAEQLESDTSGAEGPLRQDTDLDTDAAQDLDSDTSGAAGPLRQDTDVDADTAEEMDSDTSGVEGPSRFDTDMDSDTGAEGQLRPDTELDSDSGVSGPLRDDAGTAGGVSDEGAQGSLWQDRDTVQRERPQQDGVQGPMRQDTRQQPSEFDARGAEGPVPADADAASSEALDQSGAQGPMGQETDSGLPYQPSQPPPQHGLDVGGAQGPMRADVGTRSYYRMYMGETNPYIDPGNIVTIPYSEAEIAGVRGPLRDDGLPANLGPTHTETNPFIDKGGGNVRTDVPAFDERGARGPLRTDDLEAAAAPSRDLDMEMRFHNYIGETNPLIDPDGVKTQPYRSGAFTSIFRRNR